MNRQGYLFGRKCEGYASQPDDLRVAELKEIATSYGLSTSGKKDDLCQRIRQYLVAQEAALDVAEIVVKKTLTKKEPITKKELPKVTKKKKTVGKRVIKITPRTETSTETQKILVKTLDELIDQLGIEDPWDLTSLSPELVDYFISIIQLYDNTQELADVIDNKIAQMGIRNINKINEIKLKTLIEELAAKFCRCIKRTKRGDISEAQAIAICRKGVINNKGLRIFNFQCEDKVTGEPNPLFLPQKEQKEVIALHPTFQEYNVENREQSLLNNLKNWKNMKKEQRNQLYKKSKWY